MIPAVVSHKHMYQKNNQKGNTLIELLLYIGLAALLLAGISSFFYLILRSRVKSQTVAEVEQQGAQIMQIVTQTIRNAENINSPSAGSSSSSLSLDAAGTGADPTIFDAGSGIARIKEGSGSAVSLNNSRIQISNLDFSNLSRSGTPGNIKVRFTLTHQNPGGRNEYDYSKTFYGTASLRQ